MILALFKIVGLASSTTIGVRARLCVTMRIACTCIRVFSDRDREEFVSVMCLFVFVSMSVCMSVHNVRVCM